VLLAISVRRKVTYIEPPTGPRRSSSKSPQHDPGDRSIGFCEGVALAEKKKKGGVPRAIAVDDMMKKAWWRRGEEFVPSQYLLCYRLTLSPFVLHLPTLSFPPVFPTSPVFLLLYLLLPSLFHPFLSRSCPPFLFPFLFSILPLSFPLSLLPTFIPY